MSKPSLLFIDQAGSLTHIREPNLDPSYQLAFCLKLHLSKPLNLLSMAVEQWRAGLLLAMLASSSKAQMIRYLEDFQYKIYAQRKQEVQITDSTGRLSNCNAMLVFSGQVLDFIDNENRPETMEFESEFQQLRPIAEKLVGIGEMSAHVLEFFL